MNPASDKVVISVIAFAVGVNFFPVAIGFYKSLISLEAEDRSLGNFRRELSP